MEQNFENKKRFMVVVPSLCKQRPALGKDKQPLVNPETGEPVMIEPTFTGEIILRRPNHNERQDFVDTLNLKINEEGDVDVSAMEPLKMVRSMVNISEKFYAKVDLTRIDDGERFESFEDLSFDAECDPILMDVATALMNGNRVSKNSNP